MKQITYRLENYKDFKKFVLEVRRSDDYKNARTVLFKVMAAQFPDNEAKDLYKRLKTFFSKATIVGISMTRFTLRTFSSKNATPAWAKRFSKFLQNQALITCCFFDSTDINIFEVDGNEIDNFTALAHDWNDKLKQIPNLKAVEVLYGSLHEGVSIFMDILSAGLEDVPFFGAEAGIVENVVTNAKITETAIFNSNRQYILGRKYHEDGIVLVTYSGADLHVTSEYHFGWQPIGKEMTITSTLGINCIETIDDAPAIEVYKKYLGIEPNDSLLFNVFDFPLVVNRGTFNASRVAVQYDEEGRMYMLGDVKQNEKIRFTYGNPEEILQGTWKISERIRKFIPQAIFTYICAARSSFLGADFQREIKDFLRINSETSYCFGNSELYKFQGNGGQLATSILAVAMREGEVNFSAATLKSQTETNTLPIILPLTKRLANFLKAITNDLKESNEKFKEAALAADAANKSKSQFLSNMSHEIRTPINAILGMNEMILREETNPTILEYAENVRNAGNTLLGIVNDILDFSKIEAGKMEIIPVEYALSSLLNDLVNMIQSRAEKKGLAFNINAAANLPSELFGDEIRIKQVVTNILTNAVKYTEQGGVTLTVNFTKIDDKKIKLFFSVKDTGIGIKPEDIKKLFSAFERIEEKRNRSIEGTGLGMNITQRLLNMMGTNLQVESVYGEGSNFYFEIEQPVINWHELGNFEESFRNAVNQHKKYREKFTAPNAKILVVDDTVMNLTVVKGLLKQTKVQIDTADSGYECLGLVTKNKYDIIFLDHRMPGIDGIETLQRMKVLPNNINQETPVISLTANAISGAREEYINAGFQDYLTKPIDSEKLESMMIEYLPPEKVNHIAENSEVEETAEESLPNWLEKVDGLSTEDGLKNCGSVDLYLDALTVFANAVTSGAKEIAKFYEVEDWKNYTTKVHALKSSARVIGANELSERAKRLEDAGNSGYINEIKNDTDELLELYISFAEKLKPLIKVEDDDADKPLIDAENLAEAYEALQGAAIEFDFDTAQMVLESLAEYKIPDAEKEKFSQIKSAVSKPDWIELKKILG